ncbi:MAG: hypothetical protein KBH93_00310 [Anaerolineae bacterium]|nr:hypothetical protein [Anaerolineae bacterium]
MFVDEAGFYLLPMAVSTYAPCGQTPILRVPLTRDHLSAISAITPQGKLYIQVQDTAFDGPAIVRFLRHLLRQPARIAASLDLPVQLAGVVYPLVHAALQIVGVGGDLARLGGRLLSCRQQVLLDRFAHRLAVMPALPRNLADRNPSAIHVLQHEPCLHSYHGQLLGNNWG